MPSSCRAGNYPHATVVDVDYDQGGNDIFIIENPPAWWLERSR